MPRTVQAAVCRAFGEPLTIEELTLADPGPDELCVRVAAVAICHSDVSYADGAWGGALPAVYGHEAAGWVEQVGDGAGEFVVGDRVAVTLIRSCGSCVRCRRGHLVACTTRFALDERTPLTDAAGAPVTQSMRCGAFADHVVVHRSQVVRLDDAVPMPAASLLACGVITGVGAVRNTAAVPAGSAVVVVGCGGVGLNVVQGAAIAEAATVVAVDLQDAKLDLARTLGATHVANPTRDNVSEIVAAATDQLMADYVFVAAGSRAALETGMALVGSTGALVIVGMPPDGVTLDIDPSAIASYGQRIIGSKMGSSHIRRDIPDLVDRYRAGSLELDGLISGVFPLEQINEAMDGVRAGTALRNVVVFDTAEGGEGGA